MPSFDHLFDHIPEDLRQQAEAEAAEDATGDRETEVESLATLLVYDVVSGRLACLDQVPDVYGADRITGLLLVLAREIATHPEGCSPRLREQIDQLLDAVSEIPPQLAHDLIRQMAGGDPS